MSIVRFSCKRACPLAPTTEGAASDRPYDRRSRLGAMSPLTAPSLPSHRSDLFHYVDSAMSEQASALADGAPVVAMTHGYLYDPFHSVDTDPRQSDNAHRRLFHFEDYDSDTRIRTRSVSWPRDLGFAENDGGESGVGLAFAWHSKPGLAGSLLRGGQNPYARAYSYANESSWVFVVFLEAVSSWLAKHGYGQPIDLFVHSLGSRIVMRALAQTLKHAQEDEAAINKRARTKTSRESALAARDRHRALCRRLGRVVILGGSEYVVEAQVMYRRLLQSRDAIDLGDDRGPFIYNVVSRENDVLDLLGENFGPRTFGNTNVIGHNGLGVRMEAHRKSSDARWCDIPIDSTKVQRWMAERGVDVSGDQPGQIWDHWYYYTWPGNMALYRKILRERDGWAIEDLVGDEMPQQIERGWFGD